MLTTNDVSAALGISLRQLQWWDERKLLSVERVGHKRVYSHEDFQVLRIVAELRRCGLSLQRIRAVIGPIQRHIKTAPAFLVIRGTHVAFAENAESAITVMEHMQRKFAGDSCVLRLEAM